MWFRPDSFTSTSGKDQVLFEDGGGTGISLSIKDGVLSARKLPTLAAKTFNISGLTAGEFINAVMTYNTSTNELELYVNGTVVPGGPDTSAGGDWSGGDGAALGTRGQANMGGFGNGSSNVASFDGDIGVFRFYERVLTSGEVANNFAAVGATTVYFDNEAIDPFWGSDLNWDTNIPPTSAQDVVINSGAAAVLNSANARAKTLTLGSNGTSAFSGSVAAGSGTLTIASGDLVVAGDTTLGADSHDGTLILDGGLFDSRGDILGDDGGSSTLTLGGGTLELNGNELGTLANPIDTINYGSGTLQNVGEINGGTTGLVKNVGGTLTLAGTNTYTGGTTISAGTLALGVNDALPSAGAVTINTGGALDLGAFNNTVGQFILSGGTLEGSTGVLSSNVDFGIESGVVNGILGGLSALNKISSGIATVNGTSAYTGDTIVSAGTLIAGAANALNSATATVVNSGGHLNFFDGTGATTFNIPTLTLNAGSGIGGELGGNITTGAVTAAGTIDIDVYASPANPSPGGTTFILVNAASGLSGATYQIGNVYGNTDWTVATGNLITSDTQIQVTRSPPPPSAARSGKAASWAVPMCGPFPMAPPPATGPPTRPAPTPA